MESFHALYSQIKSHASELLRARLVMVVFAKVVVDSLVGLLAGSCVQKKLSRWAQLCRLLIIHLGSDNLKLLVELCVLERLTDFSI